MDQTIPPAGSPVTAVVRASASVSLALLALVLFPADASAIERFDLPGEAPLTAPRVELALTNARVEVHLDRDQTPSISARPRELAETTTLALDLDRSQSQTSLISRPDSSPDAPWMVVEIFLSPDQVFNISGASVDLMIEGTESCQGNDAISDTPAGPSPTPFPTRRSERTKEQVVNLPRLSVDVSDSSVRARCLSNLDLTAERGTIDIEDFTGPMKLDLTDAVVEIRGHRGGLTVAGRRSDLTIEGADGSANIDVVGGSFTMIRSNCRIVGRSADAIIDLNEVNGGVQLTGDGSSLTVSNSREASVRLSGRDNRVSVDRVSGPVRAHLQGGSIDGGDIEQRIDLDLSESAEGDLRDLHGDIAAAVVGGSYLRIAGVEGHSRLRVADGSISVSQLKSLELDAEGSTIEGFEILKLSTFLVKNSNVNLSLPELKGRPEVTIKGDSFAVFEIPTPCSVEPISSGPFVLDQVEITGCQLVLPNIRQKKMATGVDGRAPVHLRARIDEMSRLEIDGRP